MKILKYHGALEKGSIRKRLFTLIFFDFDRRIEIKAPLQFPKISISLLVNLLISSASELTISFKSQFLGFYDLPYPGKSKLIIVN